MQLKCWRRCVCVLKVNAGSEDMRHWWYQGRWQNDEQRFHCVPWKLGNYGLGSSEDTDLVCVCVCVCAHVYLVYEDTNLCPHTITPSPAWTVETRQDGSVLSCSLRQILTLSSECCSRNRDSIDQATFFQSSIVQFWGAWVNCSLRFLFLADRSGTRCGLLLL